MSAATLEPHRGVATVIGGRRAVAPVRAVAIAPDLAFALALAMALALAGCMGGPDPDVVVPTEELYLGGGVAELDHDTGGASLFVTIGPNVTALRMELIVHAVGSMNPRVYGLPGCEWRVQTTTTTTETLFVECFEVVPGEHQIRVEHDGGELRMAVRVLGQVPTKAQNG